MKISFINGVLKIDDKEVQGIVFLDGSFIQYPFPTDSNEIFVDGTCSTAAASGSRNTVISGRNIISPGSVIKCGGDFRLGDG